MTRPFYRELHLLRKAIEQVEGRRVEEIGLPTQAFAKVLEELKLEPTSTAAPSFVLYGVRVVYSFDSVVSFILEERSADARAKEAPCPES